MGSAFTAPGASVAPAVPSSGARWHHNLETVDVDALEALYAHLAFAADLLEDPGTYHHAVASAASSETRAVLVRGMRAGLVAIYHELLVRGGRAIVAGDALAFPDVADFAPRRSLAAVPRCESPVCELAHDVDGRHRKAAHV